MKQMVLGLAMLSLPFWLPAAESNVYACEEAAHSVTLQQAGPATITLVSSKTNADAEGQGWLGVSVDAVPEAMAAQLDTEGEGVLVLNVVKDSPAEKAGLRAHDVILAINGRRVDGDAEKLAEMIRSFTSGTSVNLDIFQEGQKKNVRVALGARPDKFEWKFEVSPDARVEEHVRTKGRIIGKDPSGKWFMKDLGDLQKLEDLPENIRVMVQGDGNRSTQIRVENNQVKVHVNKDGETIIVEREGDGPIEVERVDRNGTSTNATYADEDGLLKADPEAHGLFSNAGNKALFIGHDGMDKDVLIKMAPMGDWGEWSSVLDDSLREAREAFEQAREELEAAKRQIADQMDHFNVAIDDDRDEPGGAAQKSRVFGRSFSGFGKPKQSFSVQPDGRIDVCIRKGDSEVVRSFTNEADLARRDPALYQKYQDVMAPEE